MRPFYFVLNVTLAVDYILFLVADVTVTPNLNEIRDYKYISKEELQSMFEDPSKFFFSFTKKYVELT
jgi:isopentenyl-diphosphate delta-isomerase